MAHITDSFFVSVNPGANSNLAPKKFRTQNEIDWVVHDHVSKIASKKKLKCAPVLAYTYCAELILWTSRTGD